ncbi:MAG: hypothetical protein L0Y80_10600 [Ignavibacteriae bacterium]|nr:hypothetical protein [Ignavibacteriota bacterium]MCI0707919.1 hypothetical protein [Ignavibacteriota bacterium]
MNREHRLLIAALFLCIVSSSSLAQTSKTFVVPTVVTAHYDASEPESHGVITVSSDEKLKVEVRDLARNAEYTVSLLDERTGKRNDLGALTTDRRGYALKEFSVAGMLNTFNAVLILSGEDVIQYAQLREVSHGCICKHSGGSIVTTKLDQECYECPCGVKYEVCCRMKK